MRPLFVQLSAHNVGQSYTECARINTRLNLTSILPQRRVHATVQSQLPVVFHLTCTYSYMPTSPGAVHVIFFLSLFFFCGAIVHLKAYCFVQAYTEAPQLVHLSFHWL